MERIRFKNKFISIPTIDTSLPKVSCMCLTFGRPHLLEEAIYSFLQQDYKGVKELIVLNDHKDQQLVFVHPEVVVVNINKRFKTVGEKRNTSAALCSHDLLFVWDDDDIHLPHRISYSVNALQGINSGNFFKTTRAWFLSNGKLSGPVQNAFHGLGCWSRQWFDNVGGYTHMGSGQDVDLEVKFERSFQKKNSDIENKDIYYIYRWGGTGSFHLSGFGKDKPGQKPGNIKVQEYIDRQIKQAKIPVGRIFLNPHWKVNYLDMVAKMITVSKSNG